VTWQSADGQRSGSLQATPFLAPLFSPLLSLTTQLLSDWFWDNASCLSPMASFSFLLFWSDISLKHEIQIELLRSDPISSSISLLSFAVIAYSPHSWMFLLLLMNKHYCHSIVHHVSQKQCFEQWPENWQWSKTEEGITFVRQQLTLQWHRCNLHWILYYPTLTNRWTMNMGIRRSHRQFNSRFSSESVTSNAD
jgi:hypothetical protein